MNAVTRGRVEETPRWRVALCPRGQGRRSFRILGEKAFAAGEGMMTTDRTTEPEKTERPDLRLRRSQRLTRSEDFRAIYDQGRSLAGRFMVLWVGKGPDTSMRMGVVASRVVGDAVRRNRAKRRLREAWRLNRHRWKANVDVVLVSRRAILTAVWEDVVADLLKLARRAGLES
jgi:ribonuclease P protein component